MANVCSFEMRIRGKKDNILAFIEHGLQGIYEAYIVRKIGTTEDYLVDVEGEGRWSVTGSMVNKDDGMSLAEQTKKYDLELEVFGYDKSEPEWIEHYHFKNGETLHEYNLPPCASEESDVDLSKYNYNKEYDIYVIKPECEEPYNWDEENEKMICDFRMSKEV